MDAQSRPGMLIPTNGEFGWSVGGCATLKVPQNERLVESKGEIVSFYHVLHEL